jgi:hypothetical protein
MNPSFALTGLDEICCAPLPISCHLCSPFVFFYVLVTSHEGKQSINNGSFAKGMIATSIASQDGNINNNMLPQHILWTTSSDVLAHKHFMLQVIILTTQQPTMTRWQFNGNDALITMCKHKSS